MSLLCVPDGAVHLHRVSNTHGHPGYPGNLLEFFYWKSWNSTIILPGLLEISWCYGICCDWYDSTMDVKRFFLGHRDDIATSREKSHQLCRLH